MYIKYFYRMNQDILSVNFVIPIGLQTMYKEEKNSFAHLIEHLVFHGNPNYTQYHMMLQIEQMGAIVNAQTNGYYTEVYARVSEKDAYKCISLIGEALLAFDIREKDYEMEKEIIEIEEKEKVRERIFERELMEYFGIREHEVMPSFEEIKRIYKELYRDWRLIIIGDVKKETKNQIESLFELEVEKNFEMINNVLVMKEVPQKEKIICTEQGGKTYYTYVHKCAEKTDVIDMYLLKYLFVEGLSALLYDEIVAERGLCYELEFHPYYIGKAYFTVTMVCEKKNKLIERIIQNVFSLSSIKKCEDAQYERILNRCITYLKIKHESGASIMNDYVDEYLFADYIMPFDKQLKEVGLLNIQLAKKRIEKALGISSTI